MLKSKSSGKGKTSSLFVLCQSQNLTWPQYSGIQNKKVELGDC